MAKGRVLRVAATVLWACAACETRTVEPVEVATVEVDPSTLELVAGEAHTARAVVRGVGGELLSGRKVSWSTDHGSVATVDAEGSVRGVGAGETTLRASVEGVIGTAAVTVLEGPSVSASPSAVVLTASPGGSSETRVVNVTNAGHGTLSGLSVSVAYQAGGPSGWLTAGLSGTTAPADLTLSGSAASLADGVYQATVTVASPVNGGSSAAVTVDLQVEPPPPAIVLGVDAVSFSGVLGGQLPINQKVTVTNGGTGSLTGLTAAVVYEGDVSGWLQADLSSSTAPTDLQLRASVGLLPVGRYRARVDVGSAVASNSPQSLTVEFEVAPASAPAREPRRR
jgi:hypothetical protein